MTLFVVFNRVYILILSLVVPPLQHFTILKKSIFLFLLYVALPKHHWYYVYDVFFYSRLVSHFHFINCTILYWHYHIIVSRRAYISTFALFYNVFYFCSCLLSCLPYTMSTVYISVCMFILVSCFASTTSFGAYS